MTRLLWLTPEVPEPGGTGGAIRCSHLMPGLVRAGIEPIVVAPTYPDQRERAAAADLSGVTLELVDRPESQTQEALRSHLKHPSLAWHAVNRPFLGWQGSVFWTEIAGRVERAIAEYAPDGVVVEHDFCAPWGRHLPTGMAAGLATQNATWVQQRRDAAMATGGKAAMLGAEARRYRRMVASALPRYSWLSAVSDVDAEALRAVGAQAEVLMSPNGADTASYAGFEADGGEEDSLIFTGTLSYPPNDDAARWLIDEVMPVVRSLRPTARLKIVGRGASDELQRSAANAEAVELVGWVDQLEPVLAASAVALAPLRSGGGTRLKIIEAFAAGRAVVATHIGAEGLDVEDGVQLRLADDAQSIAAAAVELLVDRDARVRLGTAGQKLAREHYDWTAIADRHAASIKDWLSR